MNEAKSLLESGEPLPKVGVVIDVLRAFSTAHQLFLLGVERVLLASSIQEAFSIQERFPDAALLGERKGLPITGFDFGNSPVELLEHDLEGRTVIQTTSNGVPALLSCQADEVLAGAFCNVPQLLQYLEPAHKRGQRIQFFPSDKNGLDDISICTLLKSHLFEEKTFSFEACRQAIRESPTAQKFIDPTQEDFSLSDLDWCLSHQPGSFVMKLERNGEFPQLIAFHCGASE